MATHRKEKQKRRNRRHYTGAEILTILVPTDILLTEHPFYQASSAGIEPALRAPQARVLSVELRGVLGL